MLARGGTVRLRERIEDAAGRFARHAHARIVHLDAQADRLRILGGDADHHGDAARVGELDRIAQQVDDHLAQPVRIADHRHGNVEGDGEFQLQALGLRLRREHIVDVVQQFAEIEVDVFDGQLASLDFREIEDVVDDHQQVLAGALDHARVVALLLGEAGGQQQVGHAQHAVHRRADLVAHVGEEGALRMAGRLGRVLGLFQLLGTHAHLAFQLVAVLRQLGVALLDLRQHVVEAVDQRAQLVAALVLHLGIGLAGRHPLRGGDQLFDRMRDAAPEAARQHQRHDERDAGGGRGDAQAFQDGQPHRPQARFDHDDADQVAGRVDGTKHAHRLAEAEKKMRGAGRARVRQTGELFGGQRRHRFPGRGGKAGERLAVAVVQRGAGDVVLHRQRGKRLFGGNAVGKQQGRDAVGTDHVAQRHELPGLAVGMAEHGSDGKGGKHQQQGAPRGQHGDDGQFLAEARTFEVKHAAAAGGFYPEKYKCSVFRHFDLPHCLLL